MRQMIMLAPDAFAADDLAACLRQILLLQMLLLWLESITREQIIHQSPTNDSTKYIKEKF